MTNKVVSSSLPVFIRDTSAITSTEHFKKSLSPLPFAPEQVAFRHYTQFTFTYTTQISLNSGNSIINLLPINQTRNLTNL
jgi:hypothetical protein